MMGFFTGNDGKKSMMRLLCFMVVVTMIPFLYLNPEQAPSVCTLLGLAIAGKWLQHKTEGR